MALSTDEIELVKEIDEKGIEDFYAAVLAIMFYRFQKDTKLSRQLPTEGIGNLVAGAYNDLAAYHEAQELADQNTPG